MASNVIKMKHLTSQDKLRVDCTDRRSLDCIESCIWLGNVTAARNPKLLIKMNINYILTVDSYQLPSTVLSIPNIHNLYIRDIPSEDLLSHFEDTYKFISEGQAKGVVLVHCGAGVSRSATIVIAYLMKKYKISAKEAFERVKKKRPGVRPNRGFEKQLKLYERMGFTIDKSNINFRMYRLKVAVEKIAVNKVKILPPDCMDVVQEDPTLLTEKRDSFGYRCCKCRRILASASNILQHVASENANRKRKNKERLRKLTIRHWLRNGFPMKGGLQKNEDWLRKEFAEIEVQEKNEKCLPVGSEEKPLCVSKNFIEPLLWMKYILLWNQGNINCPDCNTVVGTFNWILGRQCHCGTTVLPVFYLEPLKVEWCNIDQNV